MGKNGSSPRLSQRLSLLAAALLMAGAAMAQDVSYQVDIAPQALDQALNALAGQTGSRILFATDIAEGRQAQGLKANLTVEQALQRLVSGSGLRVQKTGDGSYLVSRPEGGKVMELSSVNISGKAPGSTTEGTASYTSGSTSSSTRLNLSSRETPQAVTVLTRQLLDDQNIHHLADAMVATPGITVRRMNVGTDGFSSAFLSRGTSINSFQIDGIPTASSADHIENTDIYDRIEIVRGATGMMNTLGSPSATINMIRKRPTYETHYKINAEAGSWDRYGSGFDLSGPLNEEKTIRGRMVAQYSKQGAWTDHYDQQKLTIYGIGELDLNENTMLALGFSHLDQDTNSPMSPVSLKYDNDALVKFNAKDSDSPDWTYYDQELTNTFVSIEHQFSTDWSGKAELRNTRYKSDSLYFAWGASIPQLGAETLFYSADKYKPENEQNSLDAYIIGSFSLFNRQHDLIVGSTISRSENISRDHQATYSDNGYYSTNYFTRANTLPKPDIINQTGKTDISTSQNSFYISSRLNLSDSTKFLMGGRVTDWQRDRDSRNFSSGAETNAKNKKSGLFVPYAGVIYDIDDIWSLYASYTSIFNPHQDYMRDANNSPLPPEEGISYEAGVKATFNEGRLNSSISFYRTDLDNRALFVRDRVYRAVSGTKTEGVELELNGEITDNWSLSSGYSFNTIKDETGERIDTISPQHIIKVFTSYNLPGTWQNLRIGGGIDWGSKTHNNRSFEQESYFIANLMARYKLSKNVTTSINLNNIFNKEYLMGYNSFDGIYGPPRNIMTSITYSY